MLPRRWASSGALPPAARSKNASASPAGQHTALSAWLTPWGPVDHALSLHSILCMRPCSSLAGQGSTAAVLGRRLAAGGEGGSIAAAVSLWGMASIAGGVLRALQVVGGRPEAAEGGWPPGLSGQEVDGLLAWPSAVLLSTRTVLMAAGPRASGAAPSLAKCVLDASYLALQQCMLPSRQSAPNAAALQQARSQVPALLHALAWTASRLPLMGEGHGSSHAPVLLGWPEGGSKRFRD
ncbi:hypothetical protein ABPG75_008339 [Micractinium tetrahymenae]